MIGEGRGGNWHSITSAPAAAMLSTSSIDKSFKSAMFATVGRFRRSITAIPLAFEAYVTYATTGNHLPSNRCDGSLICSTECFVFDILTSFSTPKSNIQSGPILGGQVRRAWKETGKDAPVGRGGCSRRARGHAARRVDEGGAPEGDDALNITTRLLSRIPILFFAT